MGPLNHAIFFHERKRNCTIIESQFCTLEGKEKHCISLHYLQWFLLFTFNTFKWCFCRNVAIKGKKSGVTLTRFKRKTLSCWSVTQVTASQQWRIYGLAAWSFLCLGRTRVHTHTHVSRVHFCTSSGSMVEPVSVVLVCLIATWLECSAGQRWPCLQQTKQQPVLFHWF